jgi:hypothetical protein
MCPTLPVQAYGSRWVSENKRTRRAREENDANDPNRTPSVGPNQLEFSLSDQVRADS